MVWGFGVTVRPAAFEDGVKCGTGFVSQFLRRNWIRQAGRVFSNLRPPLGRGSVPRSVAFLP
jgi:hypothetical protein